MSSEERSRRRHKHKKSRRSISVDEQEWADMKKSIRDLTEAVNNQQANRSKKRSRSPSMERERKRSKNEMRQDLPNKDREFPPTGETSLSIDNSRSTASVGADKKRFLAEYQPNDEIDESQGFDSLCESDDDRKSVILLDNDDVLEVSVLDSETKQLLGDEPGNDNPQGDPLQSDLASRWNAIAKYGLKKEETETIRENHPIAINAVFNAPKLNPELKPVVNTFTKERDEDLKKVQDGIAVTATILGKFMTQVLTNNQPADKKSIIQKLSECGRSLIRNQYILSVIRRKNIRSNVRNKSMKDVLSSTALYPHLFGNDLSADIKAANSIAKVGTELVGSTNTLYKAKPHLPSTSSQKSRDFYSKRRNLNASRPLPKTRDVKTKESGRSNYHARR